MFFSGRTTNVRVRPTITLVFFVIYISPMLSFDKNSFFLVVKADPQFAKEKQSITGSIDKSIGITAVNFLYSFL